MTNFSIRLGQALLVVAVCGVAAPSFADNLKSFHGSICRVHYHSNLYDPDYSLGADGFEALENDVQVVCPLTRDLFNSTSAFLGIAVEVYNKSSSAALSCIFHAMDEDANMGDEFDWGADSVSATGNGQLQITSVSPNSGNEGSFVLTCELDEGDIIYQIQVKEIGTTD